MASPPPRILVDFRVLLYDAQTLDSFLVHTVENSSRQEVDCSSTWGFTLRRHSIVGCATRSLLSKPTLPATFRLCMRMWSFAVISVANPSVTVMTFKGTKNTPVVESGLLHKETEVLGHLISLPAGKQLLGLAFLIWFNLHWLHITYQLWYKVLLLVYKAIKGSAPRYLLDLIHIHNVCPGFRFADSLMLDVRRSRSGSYGDRAFCVAGPRMWNDLPPELRNVQTVISFKSSL